MTPKTVKVLCDLGVKGEQVKEIVLNNYGDVDMLALEISGELPYMGEFLTINDEIISSGQIIARA